ncbi:hypothetical protein [Oceanithermus sp.]|uniref:hypothetical protein n=1 Tax=Oceanithermus sp. TaxID=2268145 RepID=UPI0025DC529B|nr:hypothetical protein [Oceanithermus sp.]
MDDTRDRVRLPLELRASSPDEVVVRASNDRVPDSYGTIIEVEGLYEWVEAYREHRTVNLEHDLPQFGGRPQVGIAVGFDFDPQLVVRVRLLDDEVKRAVTDGRIAGASLEFVPDPRYTEQDGKVIRYRRLIPMPELTGLALTERPSVPGANLLEVRTAMMPNWAYAVVDPAVLEGRVTDPAQIERLRWFPHHDVKTRRVDPAAVRRALDQAAKREIEIGDGATLSADQIAARAMAHLERHLVHIRAEEELELMLRSVPGHGGMRYDKSERPWSRPTLQDFGHDAWPADVAERRRIAAHFAWADDLEAFGSLRFPHHEPSKTGLGPVNKNALVTGIAVLNGARGGTNLSREARAAVYRHLAGHLRRDFGEEPAPLKRRVLVVVKFGGS